MREACFYSPGGDGSAACHLCNHRCVVAEGARGVCGVRENKDGTLYSLVYGKAIASSQDPIEKKPLFHYLPGTSSYSIATVGCNLRCMHCQNWDISQSSKEGGEIAGRNLPPEKVVEGALASGCASIAYTYTEPTVFMEYAVDCMKLARKEGLGGVFVSNGYTTIESYEEAEALPDAANIDLKAFTEKFYKEVCGAKLEPVLETLKYLVKKNVWIEVTTLIIPGYNDSKEELGQIASFIAGELGDFVPWHVSRFHPDFKLMDAPTTPVEKLREAVELGREAGLKFIYSGNIPHEESENTRCPKCGEVLIERLGYSIQKNNLREGACPKCVAPVDGVWS